MKVEAIKGYKFNNINFAGKKQKSQTQPHVTSPMKAVPVIVLMAMSPLNAPVTKAQLVASPEPQTEIVAYKEKVIANLTYEKATPIGNPCELQFISTDGNDDNFEKVILEFPVKKYKSKKNKDGETILTSQFKSETVNVQALKKVLIKNQAGRVVDTEYYVVGPAKTFASPIRNEKTNQIISTSEAYSKQHDEYSREISPQFYKDLSETFGESVDYIVKERVEY